MDASDEGKTMKFADLLVARAAPSGEWRPLHFDASRADGRRAMCALLSDPGVSVCDTFREQLRDLMKADLD